MKPLIRQIPPGGWTYLQSIPSGGSYRIEEGGLEELVDAIARFRAQNSIPVGDPLKDVQDAVIRAHPTYANSVSAHAPERDFDAEAKNLRERWSNRASNWYALRSSGHTNLLESEQADERAAICAQCPHNQEVSKDCHSCIQNTERTLFIVRQAKETSFKHQLKACAIMGHDNNAAAFMPEDMTKYAARFQDQLPDFCWLKKKDA